MFSYEIGSVFFQSHPSYVAHVKSMSEMLSSRVQHKADLRGLAYKLLENEDLLKKELAKQNPNTKRIERLREIIAQMEKYRDPNVKLR